MCGLFGYSGKNANIYKLTILGLANISRGKDSTGMLIGDNVYKSTKTFDDFITNLDFKNPVKKLNLPLIMGHTRAKTWGANTEKNAHPFVYGKKGKRMYFAHNGTLTSVYQLGQKYGFKWSEFDVDSQLLGAIIYKHGYDVFKEYEGDAACSIVFEEDNQEVLYLWKGAHENYQGKMEVERPLHYLYDKDDQGIYYSSTAEALELINFNNYKIREIQDNHLYKFVNGKVVSRRKFIRKKKSNKTSCSTKKTSSVIRPDYYGYGSRYDYNDNKLLTKTGKQLSLKHQNTNAKVKDNVYCNCQSKYLSKSNCYCLFSDNFLDSITHKDNLWNDEVYNDPSRITYKNTLYYVGFNLATGNYLVDIDGNWVPDNPENRDSYNNYRAISLYKGIMVKGEYFNQLIKDQPSIYEMLSKKNNWPKIRDEFLCYDPNAKMFYINNGFAYGEVTPFLSDRTFDFTVGTLTNNSFAYSTDQEDAFNSFPLYKYKSSEIEETVIEEVDELDEYSRQVKEEENEQWEGDYEALFETIDELIISSQNDVTDLSDDNIERVDFLSCIKTINDNGAKSQFIKDFLAERCDI